jgi:hypothetical protein
MANNTCFKEIKDVFEAGVTRGDRVARYRLSPPAQGKYVLIYDQTDKINLEVNIKDYIPGLRGVLR